MCEAHDRAFAVVAEINSDVLAELGDAVDFAISNRLTLEEFRIRFAQIVASKSCPKEIDQAVAKGRRDEGLFRC